jgi:drug/metabolite transporter (DMT)-like permease
MAATLALGILFALLCAFVTNLAFLFKHRGATAAPPVDIRRPLASVAGLFRSRWFAIGWLVGAGAWVFHVLALALAPISVVQVVLAGGLVLLAVTADRLFGHAVGPRQWAGLTAMAVGMGLFALTRPAVDGAHSAYSAPALAAFEGGLLVLAALLIGGPRLLGAHAKGRGHALGVAAGLLFGVASVATKALTGRLGDLGLLGLASPWLLVAVLGSVTAFYASARALQDGEAVPVIATTGVASNLVGIAGGIAVFGDPLPAETLGIVLQAAGFLLIVVAAALTPAPLRAARIEGAVEPTQAAARRRLARGRHAPRGGYIRPVPGTDTSDRPFVVQA